MDAISALAPTDSATQAGAPNAFGALNSEQFIKIMFTELANQDPLKPNDSAALLQQMSSLRSIQSDIDLSAKLETLVTQNQLAGAGSLIGRTVTGLDDQNNRVSGLVASVSRTSNGPVLNLDSGGRLRFDRVDEMTDGTLPPHPGN